MRGSSSRRGRSSIRKGGNGSQRRWIFQRRRLSSIKTPARVSKFRQDLQDELHDYHEKSCKSWLRITSTDYFDRRCGCEDCAFFSTSSLVSDRRNSTTSLSSSSLKFRGCIFLSRYGFFSPPSL